MTTFRQAPPRLLCALNLICNPFMLTPPDTGTNNKYLHFL